MGPLQGAGTKYNSSPSEKAVFSVGFMFIAQVNTKTITPDNC
jgi:hypothetical protein